MARVWRVSVATVATMAFMADLARAQDEPPGCPPGEWFCDEGEPLPPPDPDDGALGPDADVDALEPRGAWPEPKREIDVRRRPPPPLMERGWSEGSGGRSSSPWALALRVEGVLLDGKRDDTGLGGVGVSGRYALGPVVALDLGLDSIVGTDYNGNDRAELTLSLSSLFFLNQHPVVRSYVLVGVNTTRASVDVRGDDQTWGYFGGQTGLGVEVSLDRRIALNLDIVGFMRGRTDARAEREPEFVDSRGRVTNTSGGGLLRGGVTLYF